MERCAIHGENNNKNPNEFPGQVEHIPSALCHDHWDGKLPAIIQVAEFVCC